jgi:hypothetical protein
VNGLPEEGTDKRRPGVREPAQVNGLAAEEVGDCRADPKRPGLPVPVEKVADVGVVAPVDWPLYSTICGPGLPINGGL